MSAVSGPCLDCGEPGAGTLSVCGSECVMQVTLTILGVIEWLMNSLMAVTSLLKPRWTRSLANALAWVVATKTDQPNQGGTQMRGTTSSRHTSDPSPAPK